MSAGTTSTSSPGFTSLPNSVFSSCLHRSLLYPVAPLYALELVLCGDLSGQLWALDSAAAELHARDSPEQTSLHSIPFAVVKIPPATIDCR